MSEVMADPRGPVDAQVNSSGREGLTGTAPADLYGPLVEREQNRAFRYASFEEAGFTLLAAGTGFSILDLDD